MLVDWIKAIKSSMNTSSRWRNALFGSRSVFGMFDQLISSTMSSIGCACCAVVDEKFDCAISHAVSIAAQKNGGLSLQPICNASGMTSSISSPGFKGG